MMSFSKLTLLTVAFGAVHSLASVIDSDASTLTVAPTPTQAIEARDGVAGGPGTPILSTLHYAYTALPQQVYPFAVLRGPQFGFNQCNSTTEGPNSNCQTLIFNGPDDFCLWGSPDPNGSIGDVEAKVVAYCTKPGHGTRVMPAGAISGLQWIKTSGYIQVSGFINNAAIGLAAADQGGELDPHGADLQGNPLGGVVFSTGTPDSDGKTPAQVFNWNTFVGGGRFCFKACFNSISSPDYCENRYDLLGCEYNMPSAAQDGQYTSCEGEVQDIVGTYTTNGQTLTWSMPDPLNTPPPYTPRIPSSSNCQTFSSAQLFVGAPTSALPSAPVSSGTPGASGTGSGSGSPLPTNTAGAGSSKPSGSTGGNSSSSPSGAPGAAVANIQLPTVALATIVFVIAGALHVAL